MFVPVLILPTQLAKVKTEARFQAEDPWNGNRRGSFTVDTYVNTLRSIKAVSADMKEPTWAGGFHRALRSEADGLTRFLPESLIELWLTRQATSEALPGLLREIEPQLKKSDYRPLLHNGRMRAWAIIECVLCAFLVALSIVAVVHAPAPLWIGLAVVLGTAGVCWSFLYLFYFQKILRRKRQMQWLLERIHADSPGTAALLDRSAEKESAKLTAPPKTSEQPEQPARKFVFSIVPFDTDVVALLSNLRAAFPELAWEGGESVFGRIHLAGESREHPSKISVHLLCKEPPGPFTLTIRLEPTETASSEADALKARVVNALLPTAPQRPQPQPGDPFYTHGGNLERWASPPPLQPFDIPHPPRLISPQPMPLQTTVRNTTLDGKTIPTYRSKRDSIPASAESASPQPPRDFRFESMIDVPDEVQPAIEPRLRKAFPELVWEDQAENWDKIRIEGTNRETPRRVEVYIARNESPGLFRLGITVTARVEPEAERSHQAILNRVTSALIGWSQFHLPEFKDRPQAGADIDREEIVELSFPVERPQVCIHKPDADILISKILLKALSVHGGILDSRAKSPSEYPEMDLGQNLAARVRGAAARQILGQAVPFETGKDLHVPLVLVCDARFLIGELLEHGLAQVVLYGPGGRAPGRGQSISPRRIRVHYFGNRAASTVGFGYISYSAAEGEAHNLDEFLHLDWWTS